MIVGIIGSRRRNTEKDYDILYKKVCELERYEPIKKFVTGDCTEGGDAFCRTIAIYWGRDYIVKHIKDPETNEDMDFKNHRKFDYFTMCNIFYKRDEEIAKEHMDYLLALVTPDRKGGTEKTIKYFKRYHKDWINKLVIIN
ncbi:hypothetical protein LCGC14_2051590 [marine sediment metagenome]|uniref:Uncharacterized protein n=1 Tax=marine sediment metagenome TaxID=412755 RepID=A0A0F9HKX2_9ZZZZ